MRMMAMMMMGNLWTRRMMSSEEVGLEGTGLALKSSLRRNNQPTFIKMLPQFVQDFVTDIRIKSKERGNYRDEGYALLSS